MDKGWTLVEFWMQIVGGSLGDHEKPKGPNHSHAQAHARTRCASVAQAVASDFCAGGRARCKWHANIASIALNIESYLYRQYTSKPTHCAPCSFVVLQLALVPPKVLFIATHCAPTMLKRVRSAMT